VSFRLFASAFLANLLIAVEPGEHDGKEGEHDAVQYQNRGRAVV
jgi:hypothetical protein